MSATGRIAGTIATVLLVLIGVVVIQNVALRATFPHLERVTTDFSPAYLRRELDDLATAPGQVVFFGDSVLWGYGLQTNQTAIALLASQGCRCRNFAFKGGGPANDYALARLFEAWGIRPKAVIIEINQRSFNPSDSSNYQLHPAIAELAGPLLTRSDRQALSLPVAADRRQNIDRLAGSLFTLYAMRADIREALLATPDPLPSKPPTATDFEGTYDLEALDGDNVAVHFLQKTVALFHAQKIPVIAFMTPVNHPLVHKYVDTPEYRENDAYLRHLLARSGARVLDLDAALPAADFIDNDHLTPKGQQKLASIFTKEHVQ